MTKRHLSRGFIENLDLQNDLTKNYNNQSNTVRALSLGWLPKGIGRLILMALETPGHTGPVEEREV